MLPGIFRLVNISRSAAFLFRYCDSSCASSSYIKKNQNFYQTASFQENGKLKENDQNFPLGFSGFHVEFVFAFLYMADAWACFQRMVGQITG